MRPTLHSSGGFMRSSGSESIMMQGAALRNIASALAFCAAVLLAGCGGDDPIPRTAGKRVWNESAFSPYDSTRLIVDSVRADLNLDGIDEYVVTSRDAFVAANPALARQFDRIEVFVFDTSRRSYSSLFIDPIQNGESISFRDVTRRGRVEILARTNAGGNDPVASTGLSMYGYRPDGSFSLLFVAESGAPELRDLDSDGIAEILVTGQYWGVMAHAEVVAYTDGIHAFNGREYIESNKKFAGYFDTEIAKLRGAYSKVKEQKIRNADDRSAALYGAFLRYVIWMISKGDLYAVHTAWSSEKTFLSEQLAQDQFDDLDGLVQDALASQQQASSVELGTDM